MAKAEPCAHWALEYIPKSSTESSESEADEGSDIDKDSSFTFSGLSDDSKNSSSDSELDNSNKCTSLSASEQDHEPNSNESSEDSGSRGSARLPRTPEPNPLKILDPDPPTDHPVVSCAKTKPFKCEVCGVRFKDSHNLERHVDLHTDDRDQECEKCGDTFVTENALKHHKCGLKFGRGRRKVKLANVPSGLKRKVRKFRKVNAHKCSVCGEGFHRSDLWQTHMLKHTGDRPYNCAGCTATFFDSSSRAFHEKTVHRTARKTYTCPKCKRAFRTKPAQQQHTRKCQRFAGDKNPCTSAEDPFPNLDRRRKRMKFLEQNRGNDRPYVCEVCNRGFKKETQLKRHKITHTGLRLFKCKKCGAAYKCANSLRRHKCGHTYRQTAPGANETPHICDFCGKVFEDRSLYQQHHDRHTGTKRLKCKFCDKGFVRTDGLLLHERTMHTGERPYKCQHCPASYGHPSRLVTHKLIHENGHLVVTCPACGWQFGHQAALTRHTKDCEHGEIEF